MTGDQLRALIPADWRAAIDGTLADSVFHDVALRLGAGQRNAIPVPDRPIDWSLD